MKDYGEYITRIVQGQPNGKIFGTEMIAQMAADDFGLAINHAKAITNNQLKRLTDAQSIDRIQKGVYYKAKNTVFGKVRPNLDEYIFFYYVQFRFPLYNDSILTHRRASP